MNYINLAYLMVLTWDIDGCLSYKVLISSNLHLSKIVLQNFAMSLNEPYVNKDETGPLKLIDP